MTLKASDSVCYKEEWSMGCNGALESTNQMGAQNDVSIMSRRVSCDFLNE